MILVHIRRENRCSRNHHLREEDEKANECGYFSVIYAKHFSLNISFQRYKNNAKLEISKLKTKIRQFYYINFAKDCFLSTKFYPMLFARSLI